LSFPEIALEALNQRYALGDVGRTEYLENRDDILAAQRSAQVADSHVARSFGEKVKSAWRTLSAPGDRSSLHYLFLPITAMIQLGGNVAAQVLNCT
jgi:hypothetical protein